MEAISNFTTDDIAEILAPTVQVFHPLLLVNKESIFAIPRQTFDYGPHPRQKLDIFEPQIKIRQASPILVFFYGGGLVRGSKDVEYVPDHLVYHNLGTFFANRGFVTIIPDYRRVNSAALGTGEDAVFPSGGDDVSLSLDWIQKTYLAKASQQRDLFVMGNSAGGLHSLTFLLYEKFAVQRRQLVRGLGNLCLRGVIAQSAPLACLGRMKPYRRITMELYYPQELAKDPERDCGEQFSIPRLLDMLVLSASQRPLSSKELDLPPILCLNGEREPEDEILAPWWTFVKHWDASFGGDGKIDPATYAVNGLECRWMMAHNHISPPVCLMSGEGEQWGEDLVIWMKKMSPKKE